MQIRKVLPRDNQFIVIGASRNHWRNIVGQKDELCFLESFKIFLLKQIQDHGLCEQDQLAVFENMFESLTFGELWNLLDRFLWRLFDLDDLWLNWYLGLVNIVIDFANMRQIFDFLELQNIFTFFE